MLLNFHSDDFDDITAPPTRAHIVLGLMFPLHILAVIFVTARILVKAKLKKLGVEDVCIVIALVRYIPESRQVKSNKPGIIEPCTCSVSLDRCWYVTLP